MATTADIELIGDIKLQTPLTAERQAREFERRVLKNFSAGAAPLGRLTGKVSEFDKSLEAANARVIAFGASAGVIAGITTALQQMVSQAIKVEKTLLDINVLFGQSASGLAAFSDSLFDVAKNTGQSFFDVAEAAKEFSRQGLGVEETLSRTSDAMILARLTGLEFVKSVEQLTASVNQFSKEGLTTADVINRLANVDAKFAVSAKDLSEGLSRAGSVAQDAGASFNELIALITAVQQRTARGGAVIGNALKTIFTRAQRSDTLDSLEQLGIGVRDLEGKTLPVINILSELSQKYDSLGSSQQAFVSELVGGGYQINIVKSLFDDLGRVVPEYSKALDAANKSTDEAYQRNELLNKSLASLANEAGQNLTKLAASVGKITLGPALENIFGLINSVGDSIDGKGIGEKIGTGILTGIGDFIGGPGLVYLFALAGKLFKKFGSFAKDSIGEVLSLGAPNARILDTQKGIVELLNKDINARNIINSTVTSQVQKEQQLIALIKERVALSARDNAAQLGLSRNLVNQGVIYKPAQGTFRTKAGGHMPMSINSVPREAIVNEVMGAKKAGYSIQPSDVRVMKTQIDGKPTTVVYNNKEKVIHDYMGSGEPAIIPPTGKIANYPDGLLNTKFGKFNPDPYASIDSANSKLYNYLTETLGISTKKLPLIDFSKASKKYEGLYTTGTGKIDVFGRSIESQRGGPADRYRINAIDDRLGDVILHEGFHFGYGKNKKASRKFFEENSDSLYLPTKSKDALRFVENTYGADKLKGYEKFAVEEAMAIQFPKIFGYRRGIRNAAGGIPKTIYRGVNSKYGDKNRGAGSIGVANKLVATLGKGNYSDNKAIGGLFGDKVISKNLSGIKDSEILNLSSYNDIVGLYKQYETQLPQGLASKIKNSSGAEQLGYIQQAGASLTGVLKKQGVKLISAPFAGGDAGVIGSRGLAGRMYIPLAGGYMNAASSFFNASRTIKQGGFVKGANKPTLTGMGEILSKIGISGDFSSASGISEALKSKVAKKKLYEYLKKDPIKVSAFPENYFEIGDGNHRRALADLAGIKNIPSITNFAGGRVDFSAISARKLPTTLKEKLAEKYAQAKGVAQKAAIGAAPYVEKADDVIGFARALFGFSGGYMNAAVGFDLESANAKKLKEIASLYGVKYDKKDSAVALRQKIRNSKEWRKENKREAKAAGASATAAQQLGSLKTPRGFSRVNFISGENAAGTYTPLTPEQRALKNQLEGRVNASSPSISSGSQSGLNEYLRRKELSNPSISRSVNPTALEVRQLARAKRQQELVRKKYFKTLAKAGLISSPLGSPTTNGFRAQSRLFNDFTASPFGGSSQNINGGASQDLKALQNRLQAPYRGSDPYAFAPAFLPKSQGGADFKTRRELAADRLARIKNSGVSLSSGLFNFTDKGSLGRRTINYAKNQRFSSAAFSASFAAPLLGGLASEAYGGKNREDQRSNRKIQGVASSIGAGAALGATFGGPIGAAIGASVAIIGSYNSIINNSIKSFEDLNESLGVETQQREKILSSLKGFSDAVETLQSTSLSPTQRREAQNRAQSSLSGLDSATQAELLDATKNQDFKKVQEINSRVAEEKNRKVKAAELVATIAAYKEKKFEGDSSLGQSSILGSIISSVDVNKVDEKQLKERADALKKLSQASKETESYTVGDAYGLNKQSVTGKTRGAQDASGKLLGQARLVVDTLGFDKAKGDELFIQLKEADEEKRQAFIDLIANAASGDVAAAKELVSITDKQAAARKEVESKLDAVRNSIRSQSLKLARSLELGSIRSEGSRSRDAQISSGSISLLEGRNQALSPYRSESTNIRLDSEIELVKARVESEREISVLQENATNETKKALIGIKKTGAEIPDEIISKLGDGRDKFVKTFQGLSSVNSPEQAIRTLESLASSLQKNELHPETKEIFKKLTQEIEEQKSLLEGIKNNTKAQIENSQKGLDTSKAILEASRDQKISLKAFETSMKQFSSNQLASNGPQFAGIQAQARKSVNEGLAARYSLTDPVKIRERALRYPGTEERKSSLQESFRQEDLKKSIEEAANLEQEFNSGVLLSPEQIAKARKDRGQLSPEDRAKEAEKAVYDKYYKEYQNSIESQDKEKSNIDSQNKVINENSRKNLKERTTLVRAWLDSDNPRLKESLWSDVENFDKKIGYKASGMTQEESYANYEKSRQITYTPTKVQKPNVNQVTLEANAAAAKELATGYRDEFSSTEEERKKKLDRLINAKTRIGAQGITATYGAKLSPFLAALDQGSYTSGTGLTVKPGIGDSIAAQIKSGQFGQVQDRLTKLYPTLNAQGQSQIRELLPSLQSGAIQLKGNAEKQRKEAEAIAGEESKPITIKFDGPTKKLMESLVPKENKTPDVTNTVTVTVAGDATKEVADKIVEGVKYELDAVVAFLSKKDGFAIPPKAKAIA